MRLLEVRQQSALVQTDETFTPSRLPLGTNALRSQEVVTACLPTMPSANTSKASLSSAAGGAIGLDEPTPYHRLSWPLPSPLELPPASPLRL
mmetsp:Transcript_83067/g.268758  ORF Transcript_83067/g.268758 Transcript_83067/m.268758 type:complete len:92 (-) Transcript_83067:2702-2977(-)